MTPTPDTEHGGCRADDTATSEGAGTATTRAFAFARRVWRRLRAPVTSRPTRRRDRGVALLIVITWVALMTAVIGEFTYGTTVDAAQAANARDELRAHYLARSSVNLSRLLIKIQQRFVEPVMGQAQKMLQQAMGAANGANGKDANNAATSGMMGGLGISLRVTDYAGLLMGFFSGSKDEVEGLGGLIGLDIKEAKGLGLKSGRFDAEITAEDAKIDVNCGGGGFGFDQTQKNQQMNVYRLLMGLMYSPRYDLLFTRQNADGQYVQRTDVARAIIDWADGDETMFSPEGGAGAEDYRYDAARDKYRAHNYFFDSLDELKLVRGVSDSFMEAFAPYLTVYPSGDPNKACRVNLGAVSNRETRDCTPIVMGVIRAAAIGDPTKAATADPGILDDRRLYPLASILCERASAAGFDSTQTLMSVLQKPEASVRIDDPRYRMLQGMKPLALDKGALDAVAYVGPVHTYRVVATGESGKVKKKITAIVETNRQLSYPLTQNVQSEMAAGVLQYWREE